MNFEKGKSLTTLLDSYSIIDIITTGYDYRWDNIIEVSALKIKNNRIVDRFNSLINNNISIDPFITDLTGITDAMLSTAEPADIVLSNFYNFLGDDILVGHAINFDLNFLTSWYKEYLNKSFLNDYVDTLRISRKLVDIPHHRLVDLISFFNLKSREYKRSNSGCETVYEIYKNLQKLSLCIEYDSLWIKKNNSKLKATDILSTTDNYDEDNYFFGKVCVFTGTLEKMPRREAMQKVADFGGINADSITKKTNILILGNNDYCMSIKNGKSNKQKKAEQLKLKGNDIEVISENVFYDLLNF